VAPAAVDRAAPAATAVRAAAAAGRRASATPNSGVGTGPQHHLQPPGTAAPLDRQGASAALAPAIDEPSPARPWNPRRLHSGPSSHCAHPCPVLRHLHSIPATAWHLGSGWPHCRPESDVPPGVFSLSPRHRRHSSHVVFEWYTHVPSPPPSDITVGNGTTIPNTYCSTSTLSSPNSVFRLNNVLVAPDLVRNLLSVRQFTRDNACSTNRQGA
jgi:hypothetical protein